MTWRCKESTESMHRILITLELHFLLSCKLLLIEPNNYKTASFGLNRLLERFVFVDLPFQRKLGQFSGSGPFMWSRTF